MHLPPRCAPVLLALLLACGPTDPPGEEQRSGGAASAPAAQPAAPVAADSSVRLARLVRQGEGDTTTACRRFAGEVAEAALRFPGDAPEFLRALQEEFVAGASEPFALEEGLRERRWNPAYFYPGGGGFRDPWDDDRPAHRRGGNHQPGHFVSVLTVAATLGAEQARLAIAYAGDYDPEEEDDLRLSGEAIRLGEGLRVGVVRPAEVALAAERFCE